MTDDERERDLRLEIARVRSKAGGTVWRDKDGQIEVWDMDAPDGPTIWDKHRAKPGAAGSAKAEESKIIRRERCIARYRELRAEGHGKGRAIAIIVAETGYSDSSVGRYVKGGQSMD